MSNPNEYICISCWTSFTSDQTGGAEVLCPHCGYAQPSANDYLNQGQSADSGTDNATGADAGEQQNVGETPQATATTENTEWSEDGASDVSRAPGLEPISFDELEELETLLSSSELPADAISKQMGEGADLNPATAGETTAVDADTDAGDAPVGSAAEVIWRLKSDYGLTYSFYGVQQLIQWAKALGEQKRALVTNDGILWKPYAAFVTEVESAGDAQTAFQNTQSEDRPAPQAASPVSADLTNNDTKSLRSPRGTSVSRRPKPSDKGGAAKRSRATSKDSLGRNRKTAASRRKNAANSKEKAEGNAWSDRIAFMTLGMMVGGSIIYFGMYLLGYYDIVLPF